MFILDIVVILSLFSIVKSLWNLVWIHNYLNLFEAHQKILISVLMDRKFCQDASNKAWNSHISDIKSFDNLFLFFLKEEYKKIMFQDL